MLTQTQQQLSELNKAYFDGELRFSEYRQKREDLLSGLFDDVTIPNFNVSDTIRAPKTKLKSLSKASKPASNELIILAISFLSICVIIAIVYLFVSITSKPLTPHTASLKNNTIEPQNKLTSLVKNSISHNIWTAERINEISSLWNQLPPTERKSAKNSLWYPKLTDMLKSLALEQKALVDIGSNDAVIFEQNIKKLTTILQKK